LLAIIPNTLNAKSVFILLAAAVFTRKVLWFAKMNCI